MTPTKQDKELQEQLQGISYKAVVSAYNTSQAGLIDYAHELAEELMQLITADRKRVALEARLDERKELALDLYQGHTFSNSTDFRVKFNKFIKNNNRRIAELETLLSNTEEKK